MSAQTTSNETEMSASDTADDALRQPATERSVSEKDCEVVKKAIAGGLDHLKWSLWAASDGLDENEQETLVNETTRIMSDNILRGLFPDLFADIDKQDEATEKATRNGQHTDSEKKE